MSRHRVIAIGLDGGTWDIIEPLARDGTLPTFARILERSAYGDLASTVPPLTVPAWQSFSTGMNPGKLGVFNFYQMRPRSYQVDRMSGRIPSGVPELWEILNRAGKTCGVFNNPATYPVKPINRYLVAGFLAPSEDAPYTHPPELRHELDRIAGGYELDASHGEKPDQVVIDGCMRVMAKRAKVLEHFLRKGDTDFYLGVFTETDRICHQLLNKTFHADAAVREPATKALRTLLVTLDGYMERLLRLVTPEDWLILLSDHGSGRRDQGFYMNRWLANEGYLSVQVRQSALARAGITQRRIKSLLDTLHAKPLERWIRARVPRWLDRMVPQGAAEGTGPAILDLIQQGRIDWSRTSLVAIPGGIYINTTDRPNGIVKPGGPYNALVDEVLKKLRTGVFPPLSRQFHVEAHARSEIYHGPYTSWAPDIVYTFDNYRTAALTSVPASTERLFESDLRIAHHRANGMFAVAGPDIQPQRLEGVSIMDLAPTILHLFGVPIPRAMDGRVLQELFTASSPFRRAPRFTEAATDERQRIDQAVALLQGDPRLRSRLVTPPPAQQ